MHNLFLIFSNDWQNQLDTILFSFSNINQINPRYKK